MAQLLRLVVKIMLLVELVSFVQSKVSREKRHIEKPNIILMLADDMGYGDLASYGHPTQEYGPVDYMAQNGLKFMQAYSSDSVCSPSRAALLTGRLPVRTGVWGETHRVFLPWLTTGLPREEITIAEALQGLGYKTGMVGKWHLGINKYNYSDGYHLPTNHGFDFVGHMIPFGGSYSCDNSDRYDDTPDPGKCSLYYGDDIVQQPYYQENLTVSFVDDITGFLRRNKDNPFFFYFAMMHPHAPLFSSPQFKDSSKRGRYGDNINELGWAVGSVIEELESLSIEEKTLVIFMSDHGPHLEYCLDGGHPGIFRGYKSNSFEGGYRVPLVSYWPGTISPGITHELFSALDLYGIFLDLAGGQLPADRPYDCVNGADVLLGKERSSRNFILFYNRDVLFAVRYDNFKVHFLTQEDLTLEEASSECLPPGYPANKNWFNCNEKNASLFDCITEHDPPLIFDLDKDPTESWPLDASEHAQLLEDIDELLVEHRRNLVRGRPLMDDEDHSVKPCCNKENGCYCNFPEPERVTTPEDFTTPEPVTTSTL